MIGIDHLRTIGVFVYVFIDYTVSLLLTNVKLNCFEILDGSQYQIGSDVTKKYLRPNYKAMYWNCLESMSKTMDYGKLSDATFQIQTVQVRNTHRKRYPLSKISYFPKVLTGRRYYNGF